MASPATLPSAPARHCRDSGRRPLGLSACPGALRGVHVAEELLLLARERAQALGERARLQRLAVADHARRGERELAPVVADLDQPRRERLERRIASFGPQFLEIR